MHQQQNLFVVLLCILTIACETILNLTPIDDRTGITMPSIMGGLPLVKNENYSDSRLDRIYKYSNEEVETCEVYIYTAGFKLIEFGMDSVLVGKEFENARHDILRSWNTGIYQNLQEIKNTRLTVMTNTGKILYRISVFNYIVKGLEKRIYLLMTATRNHFIKLRCIHRINAFSKSNKRIRLFIQELSEMLNE